MQKIGGGLDKLASGKKDEDINLTLFTVVILLCSLLILFVLFRLLRKEPDRGDGAQPAISKKQLCNQLTPEDQLQAAGRDSIIETKILDLPKLTKAERLVLFKNKLLSSKGANDVLQARELMSEILCQIENTHAQDSEKKMVIPTLNALETQNYGNNGVAIILVNHRVFINGNGAIRIIELHTGDLFLEKNNANNISFEEISGWVPLKPQELQRSRSKT